jgi:hypothetical protein
MTEASEPKRPVVLRLLSSEAFLGTLVVLLSVFTATAAYQGAIADSAESDYNVEAQKVLSLSNTEFLRANQDIIQDYTMYDGYYLNADTNPEAADYYSANFSPHLQASLARSGGPFDDEYYNSVYLDADTSYDEAVANFDKANLAGDRADRYQLTILVLAVGLSLAAWASLIRQESMMRVLFGVLAAIIFVIGLINFITLWTSA